MKAKILEVFDSIQGEGLYAGAKQVFVRFFECNMHCSWCDTPHSIGDGKREFVEREIHDVFADIQKYWPGCHSVSLTGGEPLLQADFIRELLPLMKKNKMTSYLETNGVLPDELGKVIEDIDIVSMDIKLPSSTECQSYWKEHEAFLKIAKQREVFVKNVISSKTDKADIIKSINLVAGIDPNILFILQPNYFEMKNGVINKCLEFQSECVKKLNNVRILPQIHKQMKLR